MVWSELTSNLEVLWGALVAFVIVVLLTPAVGGMARLLGVVDRSEGGRRPSAGNVPRLGGLALFLGIFVPALAFLPLGGEMKGVLLGAAVATTVGAIDDFRGLRWWEKLAGQTGAAAIPVGFGVWVHRFTFPVVGIHELPPWVGIPLTIFAIVAVMNMVNFLDGLDGLAAGVCAISAFSFCLIALSLGRPDAAVLTAIVFGACLGFLRHNFYPARIFMGDSGALLLGFVLATVSVQGLLKTAALATLVLPLLVLAIPILDTSFVVARRIKHGQPVYLADRSHLHHRFQQVGFSERRSVVYLYGWCATLALAALATRFVHPHPHGEWDVVALALDLVVVLLALGASVYVVYLLEIVKLANPFLRRREELERADPRRQTA
ncbi:MAG TPA: MraY family glycosyltransferase [Gaiellaceae bacterium]|jgi:UDP-GlcNAc:undecaprenyl-phosphate GlcNAc-1-phosphate transferase